MRRFFGSIDALLRGRLTSDDGLRAGRIDGAAVPLLGTGAVLGGVYGVAMGLYAVLRPGGASWAQLFATTLKVPLLFLLTLAVTYPSLYVVSALFGSRLRHAETLRLLLIATCVNLALLASLAPVTAFFTLSTESYDFMKVLNVAFFAIAGLAGLGFLRRILNRVFASDADRERPSLARVEPAPRPEEAAPAEPLPATPAPVLARHAARPSDAPRRVFMVWVLIYGAVGAQMGWILRPFIGAPDLEFTLFRARQSNFFEAFFRALGRLVS